MITSHEDYLKYIEADRISLSRNHRLTSLLFDDVWRFQRLMRKLEYFTNCKKNRFLRALVAYQYQ